jgi:general secretion pathway protein E
LHQPNGIILVTGPTGSGKTTTLYAGLMALNDRKRNILTVEDPVEYDIEGIGQTQVHAKVGMTFARGLRAILRQDPDVVMVGEIRDQETAEIAVQASLTGHMVLSTLHTNTAIGAITRLVDIGVEPYLIASSLKGVLAQRLVRRLCQSCRQPITLDATEARLLGDTQLEGQQAYNAGGCEACQHSGYRGRQGVYELLVIDRELAEMIHNRAGEQEIQRYASARMTTLMSEGRRLVLEGQTSLDELLRSVREGADAGL